MSDRGGDVCCRVVRGLDGHKGVVVDLELSGPCVEVIERDCFDCAGADWEALRSDMAATN